MAFVSTNFGAQMANLKNMFGAPSYWFYWNQGGDTITTAGYFPADLGLKVGDRILVAPATLTNADAWYTVTTISGGKVTVAAVSAGA